MPGECYSLGSFKPPLTPSTSIPVCDERLNLFKVIVGLVSLESSASVMFREPGHRLRPPATTFANECAVGHFFPPQLDSIFLPQ